MVLNNSLNKGSKRNDTPTPRWLCKFLFDLLKDQNFKILLDPCCGDRRLTELFEGCQVINYEIKEGTDFLEETNPIPNVDCVIVNPPFNVGRGRKLSVEVFLDKIFELVGKDVPILMITPMGLRLNVYHKNKKKAQQQSRRLVKMREEYPPITTIISLPADTFEDTKFHAEIVCFNTPFLKPHYFIPA